MPIADTASVKMPKMTAKVVAPRRKTTFPIKFTVPPPILAISPTLLDSAAKAQSLQAIVRAGCDSARRLCSG